MYNSPLEIGLTSICVQIIVAINFIITQGFREAVNMTLNSLSCSVGSQIQIVPVVDESCARLMQKVAEVAESQTTVDVHKYVTVSILLAC